MQHGEQDDFNKGIGKYHLKIGRRQHCRPRGRSTNNIHVGVGGGNRDGNDIARRTP